MNVDERRRRRQLLSGFKKYEDPKTAKIHRIDGQFADLKIRSSSTVLRNAEIIGDPDTLSVGDEVVIRWRDDGRPVVLIEGVSETNVIVSESSSVSGVDSDTFENHVADPDAHHLSFMGLKDDGNNQVDPGIDSRIKVKGDGTITTSLDGGDLKLAFVPSSIDHGGLLGLGDDDHPQYGAIAQDEDITGQWDFVSGDQSIRMLPSIGEGAIRLSGSTQEWELYNYTTGNSFRIYDRTGGGDPFFINDSWDVMLGGNITSPTTGAGSILRAVSGGRVYINTGVSGATAHTSADELVIEGAGTVVGISVLSGDGDQTNLYFGTPTDNASARVTWVDSTQLFYVGSFITGGEVILHSGNNVEAIRLDSSQRVLIGHSTPWKTTNLLESSGNFELSGKITMRQASTEISVDDGATTDTYVWFNNPSQNTTRVGINMVPDIQFDLDIAGSFRAGGWIVGRHALQLTGVIGLWHFDGPTPFKTNFFGELNDHLGHAARPQGGIAHYPGNFGTKALILGGDSTNLLKNPRINSGALGSAPDNWALSQAGTGGTLEVDTERSYLGEKSAQIKAGTDTVRMTNANNITLNNNDWISFQCRVWKEAGATGDLVIVDNGTAVASTNISAAPDEQWNWHVVTYRNTSGSAKTAMRVRVTNTTDDSSTKIWVDVCQAEVGLRGADSTAITTPYFDGDFGGYDSAGVPDGSGHTWSGTAHASSSSRVQPRLNYDTNSYFGSDSADDMDKGTIMLWFWPHAVFNWGYLWSAGTATADFDCFFRGAGTVSFRLGQTSINTTGTVTVGAWNHIVCTWDKTNMYLYLNGDYEASTTRPAGKPSLSTDFAIGYWRGGSGFSNCLIDDFVILDRTVSDIDATTLESDEVKAVYDSGAPVFAESSTFQFRSSPDGLVWADEFGLWVRNAPAAGGLDVFGVFGGVGTKTWGGITMATGDLVIGRDPAVVWWDDSAGELYIGDPGTEHLRLDGTTLRVMNNTIAYVELSGSALTMGDDATGEYITVTSSGIEMFGGGTKMVDISTVGGIVLGDSSGGEYASISGTGLGLFANAAQTISIASDGDVLIGSDVSSATTTYFAIFATAQTYNTESVSAGDLLIGDNSTSEPNIFWDGGVGELHVRSGQIAFVAFDPVGQTAEFALPRTTRIGSTGVEVEAGQGSFLVVNTFGGAELLEMTGGFAATGEHTGVIRVPQKVGTATGYYNALTVEARGHTGANTSEDIGFYMYSQANGTEYIQVIQGSTQLIRIEDTRMKIGTGAISAAQLAIETGSNSWYGIRVNSSTSPTFSPILIQYNGSAALHLLYNGARDVVMRSIGFDNTTGIGTRIHLERNTNATTPAAGHILLETLTPTLLRIWPDSSGNLRIWSGNPTNANDTSGTVVGTQTSWHELKKDIREWTDYASALEAVLSVPLYSFRMKYPSWLDGHGNEQEHYGLVVMEEDRLANAWFATNMGPNQTPVLDERTIVGYLIAGFKELASRVENLEVNYEG